MNGFGQRDDWLFIFQRFHMNIWKTWFIYCNGEKKLPSSAYESSKSLRSVKVIAPGWIGWNAPCLRPRTNCLRTIWITTSLLFYFRCHWKALKTFTTTNQILAVCRCQTQGGRSEKMHAGSDYWCCGGTNITCCEMTSAVAPLAFLPFLRWRWFSVWDMTFKNNEKFTQRKVLAIMGGWNICVQREPGGLIWG